MPYLTHIFKPHLDYATLAQRATDLRSLSLSAQNHSHSTHNLRLRITSLKKKLHNEGQRRDQSRKSGLEIESEGKGKAQSTSLLKERMLQTLKEKEPLCGQLTRLQEKTLEIKDSILIASYKIDQERDKIDSLRSQNQLLKRRISQQAASLKQSRGLALQKGRNLARLQQQFEMLAHNIAEMECKIGRKGDS